MEILEVWREGRLGRIEIRGKEAGMFCFDSCLRESYVFSSVLLFRGTKLCYSYYIFNHIINLEH